MLFTFTTVFVVVFASGCDGSKAAGSRNIQAGVTTTSRPQPTVPVARLERALLNPGDLPAGFVSLGPADNPIGIESCLDSKKAWLATAEAKFVGGENDSIGFSAFLASYPPGKAVEVLGRMRQTLESCKLTILARELGVHAAFTGFNFPKLGDNSRAFELRAKVEAPAGERQRVMTLAKLIAIQEGNVVAVVVMVGSEPSSTTLEQVARAQASRMDHF